MNDKLISIIIPTYNVASYIRQSLFSVLSQTYKKLEVIIVNDGSTDNTGDIVAQYAIKDPRIVVITQKNKGLAAARNAGLKHAEGGYLCIFDSDDIMLPEKIARQYAFMESHPEYDFTYSDLYHFTDGKKSIYHHPMGALTDPQYDTLLNGNVINPNAVFFRRKVFEKYGGFDETLRSAEDWDYWLTLAYNGVRFGYQPECLTLYRMRNNSLSTNSIMMAETPIRVLEKQLTRSISEKQQQIIKSKLDYWNLNLYISFMRNNNTIRAKEIKRNNNKNKLFKKTVCYLPSWFFNLYYFLMKKIRFSSNYKKITDVKLEDYLQIIEQHGKDK